MAHADNGPQGDAMAMEAFAVVRALAVELQPRLRKTLVVREDSDLDRELGLDSLGRAELLLRLGRTFGVRLPETLLGEARTVGDLLAALRVARPGAAAYVPAGERAPEAASLPPVPEPVRAGTLIEVLAEHAAARGGRVHLRLWRRPDQEEAISYGDLDRAARAVAAGLMLRDVRPDERVGLMLPTGPGFFAAFFGVLYAGAIPVPIYPPFRPSQIEDHLRRQSGILRNAEASLLVTDAATGAVGRLLHGMVASLRGVASAADLAAAPPLAAPLPAMPATTALIQYTSGSTGDPKGVVLTHANLLANIRSMGQALEASSTDVVASWLPLYHDMGLIGCWLGSLYFGAQAAIMPPLAFLADPARWLWAIHRHRATISAAPNFAYELCLKSVRDVDIEGLDLGSLRRLANGAEPVSPATLARFAQRFGRYGLRPNALAPVYGLAESVVALAFPPPGRGPVIDRIDRDALSTRGLAVPAPPGAADALDLVACGQPIPGHEIRIVDEGGRELPERREGRLQFKGPSATAGYFRAPEKTRALFDGEWLESGDRAYIAGGDVYITGRIKDIIIRAGRHIYPQELEELVGAVEGVRRGCVAAISGADPASGTERLVVVAETRLRDPAARDDLRRRIVEASRAILPDMPPEEVVLVPPHAILKTSSGKLRRAATLALYKRGGLGRERQLVWWQLARLMAAGIGPRLWRGAAQVGRLAYAAWWWGGLVAIAVPVWPLVVALPRRRWRCAVVRAGMRAFFWLARIPLTLEAEAPLPQGGAILAVNHASYLDGAVLAALCPGVLTFTAKQELAGQRIAGPFLRRLGTVFLRRADAAGGVADAAAVLPVLRGGERLVWFPEGTLTRMPGLLGFHLGAFQVAVEAAVPIVPITIRGTRSVLRGGQWFPRHGPVFVRIGRPLTPDGQDFAAALRLRDRTRAVLLAHCGEPDLSYEHPFPGVRTLPGA
ncbi:MAG: AMP-binding protein [Rhodospirillales bacterium]|nr:AMP-binding protein [Rhodospirillales bacterium]